MARVNLRTAVYGGDQRQQRRWVGEQYVFFEAAKYGGNGELRRLDAALRAGGIGEVIILFQWNGHSGSARVRRLCRRLGVPVRVE